MHIQRRVFAPWRIWRQKTRVCSERQRQSALVAAIGLLKDAALRGSVSRPGANHVHDRATRSFSLCQRRVWPRGRSPPFLSFRLSPVRVAFVSSGPRKKDLFFLSRESPYLRPPYLRLFPSLQRYLRASFIIQPDTTKCFPWWMISCQRAPK